MDIDLNEEFLIYQVHFLERVVRKVPRKRRQKFIIHWVEKYAQPFREHYELMEYVSRKLQCHLKTKRQRSKDSSHNITRLHKQVHE